MYRSRSIDDLGEINGVLLTEDESRVIVGGENALVRVYDFASGDLCWSGRLREIDDAYTGAAWVCMLALHADSRTFFACLDNGFVVRCAVRLAAEDAAQLADWRTFVRAVCRVHGDECVHTVAASSDGRWWATGARDRRMRIWRDAAAPADASAGPTIAPYPTPAAEFHTHSDTVRIIAFARDARRVACGGFDGCVSWYACGDDDADADDAWTMEHKAECTFDSVYAIAFNAAASLVLAGGSDAACQAFSVRTGDVVFAMLGPATARYTFGVREWRSAAFYVLNYDDGNVAAIEMCEDGSVGDATRPTRAVRCHGHLADLNDDASSSESSGGKHIILSMTTPRDESFLITASDDGSWRELHCGALLDATRRLYAAALNVYRALRGARFFDSVTALAVAESAADVDGGRRWQRCAIDALWRHALNATVRTRLVAAASLRDASLRARRFERLCKMSHAARLRYLRQAHH